MRQKQAKIVCKIRSNSVVSTLYLSALCSNIKQKNKRRSNTVRPHTPPFSSDLFELFSSQVMSSSSSSSSNSSSSTSDSEQRDSMASQVSENNFDFNSENQDSLRDVGANLGFNHNSQNGQWEDDGIDIDDESLEVPFDPQIDLPPLPPFSDVSYVEPVDKDDVPPPAKRAKLDEENVEFEVSSTLALQLRKWFFEGASDETPKSVKKRYRPSYVEKDDKLKVPTMDDSIHRRLMAIKKSKAVKGKIDSHDTVLYKVQKSIVESFKPLLFLLSQELGDSKHKAAVEASLRLLSNSVGVVTRERRLNIMNQTNPSFRNMLTDKDNFSEKEVADLFGRSFVKHMVKAAKDEATLLASSRAQAPQFHHQQLAGSSRGGRGGYQNRGRGGFQNNRGGAGQYHGNNGNNRFETIPFFPILSIESLDKVGGRLKHFAKAWANFCSDPWVLDVVF